MFRNVVRRYGRSQVGELADPHRNFEASIDASRDDQRILGGEPGTEVYDSITAADNAAIKKVRGAATEPVAEVLRARLVRWRSSRIAGLATSHAHAEARGTVPKLRPSAPRLALRVAMSLAEVYLIQSLLLMVFDFADPSLIERLAVGLVAAGLVPLGHSTGEAVRDVAGRKHRAVAAVVGIAALATILSATAQVRLQSELSTGQIVLAPWVLGMVSAIPAIASLVLAMSESTPGLDDRIGEIEHRALRLVSLNSHDVDLLNSNQARLLSSQRDYVEGIAHEVRSSRPDIWGPDPVEFDDFPAVGLLPSSRERITTAEEYHALVEEIIVRLRRHTAERRLPSARATGDADAWTTPLVDLADPPPTAPKNGHRRRVTVPPTDHADTTPSKED